MAQQLIHRTFEVRAATTNRSVRVVASTDAIDSYGEIVEQTWNLDRYRKNPVVLWNHGKAGGFLGGPSVLESLPIGYATDVGVVSGKLEATLNFVDSKATPFAERVLEGFRQGSIRAVSVGFRPGRISERRMADGSMVEVLSDNDLFEISPVTLPANPEAVAKAVGIARRELTHFKSAFPARATRGAVVRQLETIAERVSNVNVKHSGRRLRDVLEDPHNRHPKPTGKRRGILAGIDAAADRARDDFNGGNDAA